MTDKSWKVVFGRNAVIEAIIHETETIEKIFLRFGLQEEIRQRLYKLARKYKIPITTLDKVRFDKLEKQYCINKISQGVIAVYSEIAYIPLANLIEKAFETSQNPVLVFLDRINDPQNLGAIARSAECSGAAGLIVTTRETSPVSPFAIKASAGAIFHLPIAKIESPVQTIEELKNSGFWIVGTSSDAEKDYDEFDYDFPVVIIIGNESKGISTSIRKHCDFMLRIPMYGKIDSLNASVSAGIILFEIQRQRRKKSALLRQNYTKDNQNPTN